MRFQKTLLAALVSGLLLAACGDDDEDGFVYTDDGRLTVMTRNMYLGADLAPVFAATSAQGFAVAGGQALGFVNNQNAISRRAGALAAEIASARPDLVGLQEATLWRIQIPSNPAAPATVPLHDFLASLLGELSARGVPYDVAVEIPLFDLEATVALSATSTADVRITDRQVILAIRGLPTSTPRSDTFSTLLPLPLFDPVTGTTTVNIARGWTAVDATVGGQQVAFYNTHLEAFGPGVLRQAQAAELAAIMDADPLSSVQQVLVGDLNSLPGTEGHAVIQAAGFTDLWTAAGSGDGFTCCFDPILTLTTTPLDERIDYVLWRGSLTPQSVTIVGEELTDRTGFPPTWPSDHAGVVGVFSP